MNFQIGQKVVYVGVRSKQTSDYIKPPTLKIGTIYDVMDKIYCCGCGQQNIHIGINYHRYIDNLYCLDCKFLTPIGSTKLFYASSLFVPLEEYEASENMVEELLEPLKQETI